jgi:hypothetical protein
MKREGEAMLPKIRILLAGMLLAFASGCLKAGDGAGLDVTGARVPFCKAYPDDPSCRIDPCAANPASAACSLSLCEKDPARPGCQTVDCAKTPTAPGCSVNVCIANPAAPGCSVDVCVANPSLPECQPKTAFAEVFPLLQANSCLTCHIPGGPGVTQGKLNMASADSAWAALVNVPAAFKAEAPGWVRVNPGKPDSSLLIIKLDATTTSAKLPNGKVYGARMPMGLAAIAPAEIAIIRKWIQDGALK